MWGDAAGDVADCVDHGISRRSGIALLWHRVVGRGEVGEVVDGAGAVQPAGLDRPAGDLGPDGVQDVIVEDASAGPGRREVPVVEAIDRGGEHDVLAAAKQDHESVTELTRDLVTIPSRGGVDSKSGAAIFCHIAAHLAASRGTLQGSLVLLFDVDEHTGGFGGAKRYFEGPDAPGDVAGVMIGYPGMDKLVDGGRGVYRTTLHVHGVASHSGGSKTTPSAIEKAAHLIRALSTAELPDGASTEFPLPGKLTVTAVQGGQGYSITPDLCTLNVDIRTTPTFDDRAAARLLHHLVTGIDIAWPGTRPTLLQVDTRWPAYALPEDSRLRMALLDAATTVGAEIEAKIAGPSNIGNYLAGLGIPATAGFGADYRGLHGTDERVRLDTIPTVQAIYHNAVLRLMSYAT
jgi:succinyl-diaminopimelate desuccinylase